MEAKSNKKGIREMIEKEKHRSSKKDAMRCRDIEGVRGRHKSLARGKGKGLEQHRCAKPSSRGWWDSFVFVFRYKKLCKTNNFLIFWLLEDALTCTAGGVGRPGLRTFV